MKPSSFLLFNLLEPDQDQSHTFKWMFKILLNRPVLLLCSLYGENEHLCKGFAAHSNSKLFSFRYNLMKENLCADDSQ
jgi:hypothetical protein